MRDPTESQGAKASGRGWVSNGDSIMDCGSEARKIYAHCELPPPNENPLLQRTKLSLKEQGPPALLAAEFLWLQQIRRHGLGTSRALREITKLVVVCS